MSPETPRASTLPAARSEPCICGGLLVQIENEDVQKLVEQHNRSGLHLFWRWRTGRMTLVRWLGR